MKRRKDDWRPIPGFERYEAAPDGRIRRAPAILSQSPSTLGYKRVTLYDAAGKMVSVPVHRAVAMAFHGAAPEGKVCACHVDGNRLNNAANNLYWGSHKENAGDRKAHDRARKRALSVHQLKQCQKPIENHMLASSPKALVRDRS